MFEEDYKKAKAFIEYARNKKNDRVSTSNEYKADGMICFHPQFKDNFLYFYENYNSFYDINTIEFYAMDCSTEEGYFQASLEMELNLLYPQMLFQMLKKEIPYSIVVDAKEFSKYYEKINRKSSNTDCNASITNKTIKT